MELGFDHQVLLQGSPFAASRVAEMPSLPTGSGPATSALDWAGLKARFIAVHALRREMVAERAATPPGGSFVVAGGQVLDWQRKSSPVVNPTGSGNIKGLSGIEAFVVGNPPSAIED
jgi:hypothetical protein